MDDLTQQTASTLVDLIKRREVSPVELARAYLNQIERLNRDLNAIVTISSDVLKDAELAEARILRGDDVGILHGLPFTVKDTIETAGLRTTSGSSIRAQHVPRRDAPAVARLKQAGAILLGKSNTAEMAMDYTADNPVFGRTNNPYDLTRTPGGSSGGEAAAIATRMSPGGIGSDLAGSIRIPAHFCGVVGLKPGTGRIPGEGQFPPSFGPYSLGGVIGPMARTVGDVALLFRALCNEQVLEMDLKGCRVAWYTGDGVAPVTEETQKAVAAAARILAEAGLKVQENPPPGIECGHDLWLKLFSRASVVQLRSVYSGREDEGGSFVRWRLRTADDSAPSSLDEYIQNWIERDAIRMELLQWLEEVPLILAPVGATNAFEHDALKVEVNGSLVSVFRAFSYSQAFNVFDLPAVSVPVARSPTGLPIGVQIAGRPFAEELVLKAAAILEEAGPRTIAN